jgi:hypothetical protein
VERSQQGRGLFIIAWFIVLCGGIAVLLLVHVRDRHIERQTHVDKASLDPSMLDPVGKVTAVSFDAILVAPSIDCVNNMVVGIVQVVPGFDRLPSGVDPLNKLDEDSDGRREIKKVQGHLRYNQKCAEAYVPLGHPLHAVCTQLSALAPAGQVGCLQVNATHEFTGSLPRVTLVYVAFASSQPIPGKVRGNYLDPRTLVRTFGQGVFFSASVASWKPRREFSASVTDLIPARPYFAVTSPQRRYSVDATIGTTAHYDVDGDLVGVGHQIGLERMKRPTRFVGWEREHEHTSIEVVLRRSDTILEIREEITVGLLTLFTELIAFASFVATVVAFAYKSSESLARVHKKQLRDKTNWRAHRFALATALTGSAEEDDATSEKSAVGMRELNDKGVRAHPSDSTYSQHGASMYFAKSPLSVASRDERL